MLFQVEMLQALDIGGNFCKTPRLLDGSLVFLYRPDQYLVHTYVACQ